MEGGKRGRDGGRVRGREMAHVRRDASELIAANRPHHEAIRPVLKTIYISYVRRT